MRFVRRLLAGMGLAAALAAATVTPASAAPGYEMGVPGGGAVLNWWPDGEIFRIYDTACDNHAVYFKWNPLNGSGIQRFDFRGGCNRSATLDLDLPEGGNIYMMVCVNIQLYEDRCSDWELSYT
jgi:hypothetical protein